MRQKKSPEKIAEMLAEFYGDRVSLAGAYHGRHSVCLFYCHCCEEWFWQNIWSLQNGYRTRCKCSFDHPQPPNPSGRNVTGHRCLPEWECYDRIPPTRPAKDT